MLMGDLQWPRAWEEPLGNQVPGSGEQGVGGQDKVEGTGVTERWLRERGAFWEPGMVPHLSWEGVESLGMKGPIEGSAWSSLYSWPWGAFWGPRALSSTLRGPSVLQGHLHALSGVLQGTLHSSGLPPLG